MASARDRRETQEQLEKEVHAMRSLQKEVSKNYQVRRQYSIQLSENELVKKELSLLEGDARVFKLIGPVLVPQDLEEARGNVEKRMEYIASETKRLEGMAEQLEKRQASRQDDIMQLQKRLQATSRQ